MVAKQLDPIVPRQRAMREYFPFSGRTTLDRREQEDSRFPKRVLISGGINGHPARYGYRLSQIREYLSALVATPLPQAAKPRKVKKKNGARR